MTKQALSEKLANFVEHYNNAFMVGVHKKKELTYTNKVACELFGITTENPDLESLFAHTNKGITDMVDEGLQTQTLVVYNNLPIPNRKGEILICDVQFGFFDKEQTEVFVEITPKVDQRMDAAIAQVNQSKRAEAILNFDERLSLVHCNPAFHAVFESSQEVGRTHYGNHFSNGFQAEIRESLLAEIQQKLTISDQFNTKMKVITSKGKEVWYSLELNRRTLDNSGQDKLMAYLVNAEEQVEREEELKVVNQYFNILQSMTKGILYRFDIVTRTLYRSDETAKSYKLENKTVNFATRDMLVDVMHHDDITDFIAYIDRLVEGIEGSHSARCRTPEGTLEHHLFTFKGVQNEDGTIREMVGWATNIHDLTEAKAELKNVNQFFDALQELSDELLFRIDIKDRILTRRGKKVNLYGLTKADVVFPDDVYNGGAVHPDDIETYEAFAQATFRGEGGVIEVRMRERENEGFGYRRISWIPIQDTEGNVTEVVGKLVDIQMLKELEEQANKDALTNTLNKRAMLETTSTILNHSNQNDIHALLFLDLDDFKFVNDNLGHAFGDQLLRELGHRLNTNTRQGDLVGRVGGDEFILFLRDIPSTQVLLGKAKLLLATISEDVVDGEKRHSIRGSAGIAIYPEHGTTYEELYHHADLALYRSKHKGKNIAMIYQSDMEEV